MTTGSRGTDCGLSKKWLLSKQDAKRYGDKLAVGRKASKGCPSYVVLAFNNAKT
jgi:hypothetical protein